LNDVVDLMDPEHNALLVKTLELIVTTRGETAHLREEIELARSTVNRSYKLLSRTQPST
jgi:hypothetical protein